MLPKFDDVNRIFFLSQKCLNFIDNLKVDHKRVQNHNITNTKKDGGIVNPIRAQRLILVGLRNPVGGLICFLGTKG